MPFQNRVTPFGSIIADPARGTVMGNRGCLHDDQKRPLRQYQARRWIICKLSFNDRARAIMTPWEYTELFFLDEATALAAGHRPCYECNRERFRQFTTHWAAANPQHLREGHLDADQLDSHLHQERITDAYYQRDKRKRIYLEVLDALPDYSFVAVGAELTPHMVLGEQLLPWSLAGYGAPVPRQAGATVAVLTPYSTVRALMNGYTPEVHPTAVAADLVAG